jgi:hypothetical protein
MGGVLIGEDGSVDVVPALAVVAARARRLRSPATATPTLRSARGVVGA